MIDLSKYKEDSLGRLVPVDRISEIDLARDELVKELVEKQKEHAVTARHFKQTALAEIEAFCQLSAEQYGVKVGGKKGFVYLTSYDGQYKIVRSIRDRFVFDERLAVAKALIDECLNEWTEGSKPEVKSLISSAFQVDKEGQISVSRILALRKLGFEHPKWKTAMQAISDSLQIAISKTHLRFYERDQNGEYQPIT